MSSFDPPLSRTTAGTLVIGAVLVSGWVLYAANHPRRETTASTVVSASTSTITDHAVRP